MNSNCIDRIFRFRDRGILLDTNLLLVFVVGNVEPGLLGGKRTTGYSVKDYQQIQAILAEFGKFVVLPQILAETAAMLKQCASEVSTVQRLNEELARFIHDSRVIELLPSSKDAVLHPAYRWLHYTDAAILEGAGEEYLIFTADGGLIREAGERALPFDWVKIGHPQ